MLFKVKKKDFKSDILVQVTVDFKANLLKVSLWRVSSDIFYLKKR